MGCGGTDLHELDSGDREDGYEPHLDDSAFVASEEEEVLAEDGFGLLRGWD